MRSAPVSFGDERGMALIVVLTAATLMMALGAVLVLLSSSETSIAANVQRAREAVYAADAIVDRVIEDLRQEPDWSAVLDGRVRSSFVDGPPSGSRILVDGSSIDLDQLTNLANCAKVAACSPAELSAQTPERPWGANNPRWTLYAYGRLSQMLGGPAVRSPFYVILFAGDDPSENDGDPLQDGFESSGVPNPGRGILRLRAEAFGPRHASRTVEVTIARSVADPADPAGQPSELRILSRQNVR
jgi:hypothetical protein